MEVLKSIGKDEMYCEWFECPNCGNTRIMENAEYCPDCGLNLENYDTKRI